MQLDINITALLTSDDVNKIITKYLEDQGYEVEFVKPKIGTRTVGHQMNEFEERYFEGIEAKVKRK